MIVNFRMKSLVIILSILFASLLFVETEVKAEDIDLEDSDDDGIPDDEVLFLFPSTSCDYLILC